MMTHENHTQAQYMSLAQAFDYFNATLFGGALPSVLVTFQRHANSRGYFAPGMFAARGEAAMTDEIALNPDAFVGRSDADIFSTLVHEMVHLWQQVHGKAPRRAYHDRQWADKMKAVGLQPSDTGLPGGRETGAKMTHYIIAGGAFETAFATLAERQITIAWESAERSAVATKKAKSKTKFTCMQCHQNAWAKPSAKIACVPCDMPMVADDETGDDD